MGVLGFDWKNLSNSILFTNFKLTVSHLSVSSYSSCLMLRILQGVHLTSKYLFDSQREICLFNLPTVLISILIFSARRAVGTRSHKKKTQDKENFNGLQYTGQENEKTRKHYSSLWIH